MIKITSGGKGPADIKAIDTVSGIDLVKTLPVTRLAWIQEGNNAQPRIEMELAGGTVEVQAMLGKIGASRLEEIFTRHKIPRRAQEEILELILPAVP